MTVRFRLPKVNGSRYTSRSMEAPTHLPDPPDHFSTVLITVRLPFEMREALKIEAHDQRTSLNKLCLSKLALPIDAADVLKQHHNQAHALSALLRHHVPGQTS